MKTKYEVWIDGNFFAIVATLEGVENIRNWCPGVPVTYKEWTVQ